MGTFHVPIDVREPSGAHWESVEALVDTGSTYSWVPRPVLERLGVGAIDVVEFEMANGDVVEQDVGEARIRIGGRVRTNLVVFGDDRSVPLLGAVTLETFSLAPDPVNRRLVPVRALAMTSLPGPDQS